MSSRGYYGIGVFHPKTEHNIGTLWRHAYIFGASYIFTVGKRYKRQVSDTLKATRHVPMFHYENIADLKNHLQNHPLIGIELMEGAEEVHAFKHPQRACYLLGSEDAGLSNEAIAACHSIVRLPGKYSMNVAVAGSLVIYERWKQFT